MFFLFVSALLYEGDEGQFDWRRENLGAAQKASFDEILVVASELGTTAGLNLEGEILWRREFLDNAETRRLFYKNKRGVSLQSDSDRSVVTGFDFSGQIQWRYEHSLKSPKILDFRVCESAVKLILEDGTEKRRSLETGKPDSRNITCPREEDPQFRKGEILHKNETFRIPKIPNRGKVQKALLLERHESKLLSLVSYEDSSLALFEDEKLRFIRDEGLAYTRDAFFLQRERLDDERAETNTSVVQSFLRHFDDFQKLLRFRLGRLLRQLQVVPLEEGDLEKGQKPKHELQAFHLKHILITTTKNKIFALDLESGDVIWSKFVKKMNFKSFAGHEVFVHEDLENLIWVDGFTGRILKTHPLKAGKKFQCFPRDGIFPCLISENSDYEIIGEMDSKQRILLEIQNSTVSGFVPKKKLEKIYQLHLEGEILDYCLPTNRDFGHTSVEINSDASVVYRHLNPNLLVVLTKTESSLILYFVEAATATILQMTRFEKLVEPASLVASDNFAILLGYDFENLRHELHVIELYESREDEGPLQLLFSTRKTKTPSSHEVELPLLRQQAFVLSQGVRKIAVTSTTRGVTPRDLILALDSDQIASIPKSLVTTRRPDDEKKRKKPIPDDETLPPYQMILQIEPTRVLSYDLEVKKIENLGCTPLPELESSSFCVARGQDIFFTLVNPAQAYDFLLPSFNYAVPVFSCILVFIFVLLTTHSAQTHAFREKWE